MYILENPVLQRELLVNLRMTRAFVLLLLYQGLLSALVFLAWPEQERLQANVGQAQSLVNLVFLGQYVLASLMAPSFAAAAVTGEKERKTYELLLATPLRPAAIVLGKLLSALVHLGLLIVASLPVVMLCLPLGGVSFYEVLAAYIGLLLSVVTFGMISVACSSYFQKTAASLIASYLIILPFALLAVLAWKSLEGQGTARLLVTLTVLPPIAGGITAGLFANTCARLLHPPDVGSEGKEVVDPDEEARTAVGLVIHRDQFPDRLFAPAKRTKLLPDGANPIYDKEIHSEIFSQGTLMLRLVIQISMVLAIPLMAFFLFLYPQHVGFYIGYVVLFNMLVGPVFLAGSITSERERQTLDLLLTTTLRPWTILSGKLLAGLRVSGVLTGFLLWPFLLAIVMVSFFWANALAVIAMVAIVMLTCLTTSLIAMLCSVIFQRTTVSLITSYVVILVVFCSPVAATVFTQTFLQGESAAGMPLPDLIVEHVQWSGLLSPFVAAMSVPIQREGTTVGTGERWARPTFPDNWWLFGGYVLATGILDLSLIGLMVRRFATRWRVAR